MALYSFLVGVALVFAGLWNRDRERLALILAGIGAILIVMAGILAIPTLTNPS